MRTFNVNCDNITDKDLLNLLNNKDTYKDIRIHCDKNYEDVKYLIREVLPKVDKPLLIVGKGVIDSNNDESKIIAHSGIDKFSLGVRKTSRTVAIEFRGDGFITEMRNGHAVSFRRRCRVIY